MGLESTQSHMSSLGRGELLQGEVLDEDAIIAAYDAVTRADVQALAGELFRFENASLSAVGRVGSADAWRCCTEIKLKTEDGLLPSSVFARLGKSLGKRKGGFKLKFPQNRDRM